MTSILLIIAVIFIIIIIYNFYQPFRDANKNSDLNPTTNVDPITSIPGKNNAINAEKNNDKSAKQLINGSTSRIIVKFKGSNYDITDFVRKHPGGKKVLLENNGNDIEKLMCENEHSNYAYKPLAKYKLQ